ncbi:MAG: hypothetical protein L0Y66_09925, partial [Myxococcaceae bacterium]|nr:hypothetical protein [Myxococcaceae bacterium]
MVLLRILALLALSALAACPGPGTECFNGGPPGVAAPDVMEAVAPRVFVPGEQVVLQFASRTAFGCGPGERPDSVRATVLDGRNVSVDASSSLTGVSNAEVEFVPATPGPHHVSVIFEPVGGLVQREVMVATDRTAEARVTVPRACTKLQRTLLGAWVCDDRVFRGAQELTPLPGSRTWVAGNTVWVMGASRISVHEDTGSGPLLERASTAWTQEPLEGVVADEHRLAYLTSDELVVLYLDAEGTLVNPGARVLSFGSGRRLMLTESAMLVLNHPGAPLVDSVTWTGAQSPPEAMTSVCAFSISPGNAPGVPARCSSIGTPL